MGITQFNDAQMKGEVQGPASATDNAIARYDGTTGKLVQDSDWTLTDANVLGISAGAGVSLSITTSEMAAGTDYTISSGEAITLAANSSLSVSIANDNLGTNSIQERTANAGVTIDGVLLKDGNVLSGASGQLDVVATGPLNLESTTSITMDAALAVIIDGTLSGVTIESVLVKDGEVDGRDVAVDGTKLDGIATGATANSSDATLLARANHTGTQTASTISDFDTEVANNSAVTANTAKTSYPGASATETLTNKNLSSSTNTFPDYYPVGTIYENYSNSANPSTYLPGQSASTWVAMEDSVVFGVGFNFGQGETGGELGHTHTLSANGQALIDGTGGNLRQKRTDTAVSWTSNVTNNSVGSYVSSSTSGTRAVQLDGATDSKTTQPPYDTAYRWRRTA